MNNRRYYIFNDLLNEERALICSFISERKQYRQFTNLQMFFLVKEERGGEKENDRINIQMNYVVLIYYFINEIYITTHQKKKPCDFENQF